MRGLTRDEIELRDAVAVHLLAAIAPKVPGPQSLKTSLAGVWDAANTFIAARRVIFQEDAADNEQVEPPLVQS